jgi:hypothetical protein
MGTYRCDSYGRTKSTPTVLTVNFPSGEWCPTFR